jgi:hypothetical protein
LERPWYGIYNIPSAEGPSNSLEVCACNLLN